MAKNINAKLVDNIIVIEIDPQEDFGLTGSGKNVLVASTEGAMEVGGVKLNISAYKKPSKD